MQPSDAPRKKSNTGLIIGLVLGCGGLCCLGVLGMGGLAWFGIKTVCGFASCAVAFDDLQKSMKDYAEANGGKLPPAATWQTDISPFYAKRASKHKDTGPIKLMDSSGEWGCKTSKGMTGIAFNSDLGGKKLADIKNPETTTLLFEVDSPKVNAAQPYKARTTMSPDVVFGKPRSWIVVPVTGKVKIKGANGEGVDFKMD